MAIIKSTVELVYDSRHNRKSIIEIEITNWNERNGNFLAEVTDFYFRPYTFINELNEEQTVPQRVQLCQRTISVPSEQVALLSEMIAPMIEAGTTEPQRREIEKTYGLLHIVQNDFIDVAQTKCIYNTDPANWVIAE